MNILFLGDVVGRSGRNALNNQLPSLKKDLELDFVIVNCENATSGIGLSPDHAKEILGYGVDCITLGDHAFDQREMMFYINEEPRIIRPLNYSKVAPGRGAKVFDLPSGKRIMVVQVLGRVFMKKPYSDPFSALEIILNDQVMGKTVDAIILDIHAEATSEKMALGHWCDGRVSLSVGTHTHIPTSDMQFLGKGSVYQTDAGMCGDYNSVIGMDKCEPISRFVTGLNKSKFVPAKGEATLCGVFVNLNASGFATEAFSVKQGGNLLQSSYKYQNRGK